MKTLTVTVASREAVSRRALATFSGKAQGAHLSFAATELLWKLLGGKRWDILKAMAGKGPMTIRGVARAVGRDVKAVHGDVQALLRAGIVDRAQSKRVTFGYDAIHVDFLLRAA
jgi:predicted transcriptional regulator